MITENELREKYIEFFKQKQHAYVPSASLIPENDPTVLFTTAGMHPLVPYLMGEKHPAGTRIVDFQKCIRTGDIEDVGDTSHLTFFEMLGNWSLGDYFKKESITWSFEFLTSPRWLNIPIEKLAVSVFQGDIDAPKDQEAADIWKSLGIPENRIYFYPKSENWWGPAGDTGPCGPDSEIFYVLDRPACSPDCGPACSCGKHIEIWNNVFMQYNKTKDGKYIPLEKKNIDTGMGLERVVAVLNGYDEVYKINYFWPIIEKIQELSGQEYKQNEAITKSMRIIADHIRTAVFILGDNMGVVPSNVDQGYVLRRLIRRAIRHAKMIEIKLEDNLTIPIAEKVIELMKDIYPELERNKQRIFTELQKEEDKFEKSLEKGIRKFEKMSKNNDITGQDAFILFSTYGFPLEITEELALEKGIKINKKEFEQEFKKHQELSRVGAEKKFKGGLADAGEETAKLHTATHLLHQALRKVLGDHVEQRGSNITAERLRFDFSYPEKLTEEQKRQVEDIVNEQIQKKLPVECKEMTVEEAKKIGAIGLFEHKYGDKVKVFKIGDFSTEICGGPHVKNTEELGKFKIKKETSSSAGIRRIKAILG